MALNLTKGKTAKRVNVANKKAEDAAKAVAEAMRPNQLTYVITALKAAVGKVAATPLHKIPKRKEVPHFPVYIDEQIGGELLLTNVAQAYALGRCAILQEQVVMSHDVYGVICLRSVEYNNGILIGLIDANKSTYCECEWYQDEKTAKVAWVEWLEAAAQ